MHRCVLGLYTRKHTYNLVHTRILVHELCVYLMEYHSLSGITHRPIRSRAMEFHKINTHFVNYNSSVNQTLYIVMLGLIMLPICQIRNGIYVQQSVGRISNAFVQYINLCLALQRKKKRVGIDQYFYVYMHMLVESRSSRSS